MSDSARASTPGYGLCGCERVDQHRDGCLWHLDRRPVFPTPREPLDRPRPWCCCICGEALDKAARQVGDDRCTKCYRVLFARRRDELLGGGR